MSSDRRPELKKQQTVDTGSLRTGSSQFGRHSSSSNLFFKSSSTSNLFRLRNAMTSNGTAGNLTNPRSGNSTTEGTNEDDNAETSGSHHMVDVLPSFEMYNALHRNIPRGNVNPDQHDLPPTYQEVQSQCEQVNLSDGTTVSRLEEPSTRSSFSLLDTPNSSNSLQSLNTGSSGIVQNSLQALSTRYEAIIDDLDDSDNINIEKLYSLPKVSTPIEVNIRILKKATKPNESKPEEESILKEYTSGDIINGFAVIENRAQQPLRFEMFYVTLEGCACVIDRKQGKRTVKRFLRMVDLSASWSYSNIDLATGFQYTPGEIDHDGCVIGLKNDRLLQPGVRYKKFFTFKFPNQLLDISCKHEIFSHCLVPPSFGVDKYKHHSRYANIKLNSMLGYGHLGTKGSPILTNDLCSENLSISYTIDARVVGKDPKSNELTIMKEREYNLRFIPFGFCQPLVGEGDPIVQVKELQKLVEERLLALERVFKRLEQDEAITASDIHNSDLTGTIDNDTTIDSAEIINRKLIQLHVANRINPDNATFPVRNIKSSKSHPKTIGAEFPYTIKSKSKSRNKLKKGIFGSLYGGSAPAESTPIVSDSLKSGIIMIECEIPEDGLPYLRPSLLKKTNQLQNKNKHDQNNWQCLQSSLSDQERGVLDHLDIRLRCLQANNSEAHSPPEITGVSTQLICLTTKAVSSFPLKLTTELLLNTDKMKSIMSTFHDYLHRAREFKVKFNENISKLTELYNKSRSGGSQQDIRFSDFITSQLMSDIESLATLIIDIRSLSYLFRKQEHTISQANDKISSNNGSHMEAAVLALNHSHSHGQTLTPAQLMKQELLHEWMQSGEKEFDRQIRVNLQLSNEIKETLIPTFESCLCSRMYCVRVNIKFENSIGVASIDIPVRIRNLEC